MARCANCDSTIVMGAKKVGPYSFCSAKCAGVAPLLARASALPADQVTREVQRLRHAPCPVCQGPGPVDIHTSYRVYSVLVMTSWRNQPRISCRACARKAQGTDAAISLVAGWWGFPWGLVMTPVQLVRNLSAMTGNAAEDGPTRAFEQRIRLLLAAAAVDATAPTS